MFNIYTGFSWKNINQKSRIAISKSYFRSLTHCCLICNAIFEMWTFEIFQTMIRSAAANFINVKHDVNVFSLWIKNSHNLYHVHTISLGPIITHWLKTKYSEKKNKPFLSIHLSFFLIDSFNISNDRSSHQKCSMKKGALWNFTKFTGKHLCQSPFFDKVAGLRPPTLLKERLWNRCFPVNFVKVLRTSFLQNTSGRLLLKWKYWYSYLTLNLTLFKMSSWVKLLGYEKNHNKKSLLF